MANISFRFVFTCKNPNCKADNTVEGLRHKLVSN